MSYMPPRVAFVFYLNLLESLNDNFLSGKVFEIPTMVDFSLHLQTVISMVFTCEYQNFQQDLFRILSKAEIFFFMFLVPMHIKRKHYDIRLCNREM